MTKGTKIFRIIIRILLALTMLCSAFFAGFFCLYFFKVPYGIYVAGVPVNRSNQDDILGDGTVHYDANNNILVLDNATIASEDTVVYSKIDLHIELIGENKLICTNEEYGVGIYAGDYNLNKDAVVSAFSGQNNADVFCGGAVVNGGAKIDGEIEAIGGIHNRD